VIVEGSNDLARITTIAVGPVGTEVVTWGTDEVSFEPGADVVHPLIKEPQITRQIKIRYPFITDELFWR
jgi:hypothetical protein